MKIVKIKPKLIIRLMVFVTFETFFYGVILLLPFERLAISIYLIADDF